jgi:hypothetical protein
MPPIGELLVLLNDAHHELSGLEVTFRDWREPLPSFRLVVDGSNRRERRMRWMEPGPWPTSTVLTRRLWFQPPGRLRVEIFDGSTLVWLGVRDGAQWWRWHEGNGAAFHDAGASQVPAPVPRLLDPTILRPARLIPALHLKPKGVGTRAGRAVVCAEATPRDPPQARGELSFELEFDAAQGTILRRAEFENGCCVQVTEAVEIKFGGDLSPQQFVFASPESQSVCVTGASPTTSVSTVQRTEQRGAMSSS